MAEAHALLEAFLIDNPDLERLEALLDQFNLFEALGVVRQEVRHSDFLAFLLSPSSPHGLGNAFVRRLLQRALAGAQGSTPTPQITAVDLALWSLDGLIVLREWQRIDLLLLDEANQLAIIIENKVDSGEHSDQLARYWQRVGGQYPGWRRLGLYLTPDGDPSSHPHYLPISYTLICELIEQIVESRATSLGPDVRMVLAHYALMLRRHIVGGSEIAELCQRIYRRHQQALDLIYEYRPDFQSELRDLVESLVKETKDLTLDAGNKSRVRFLPTVWEIAALKQGKGWTPSRRMLLFEFENRVTRLQLNLYVGPGPQETREWLYDRAKQHGTPFNPRPTLGVSWGQIYRRGLLDARDYDGEPDQIKAKVRAGWDSFRQHDLDRIIAALPVSDLPEPEATDTMEAEAG